MSKTNHRINKDRPEREGEAEAHKARRYSKQRFDEFVELYEADPSVIDEFYDDEEFVQFEKIQRKVRK